MKQREPREEKSPQYLVDQGNEICARIGRKDLHWVVRNGHPHIEWKCPPQGNLGK
jgi:hypothetical protein